MLYYKFTINESKLKYCTIFVIFSFIFFSCPNQNGDNDKPTKTYIISFNSNGGTLVLDQTVSEGLKAIRPSNPIKIYYSFDNWYIEPEFLNIYSFDTQLTEDITIHAKWIPVADNEDFGINANIDQIFNILTTEDWNNAILSIKNNGSNKNYILNINENIAIEGVSGQYVYTFDWVNDIVVSIRGTKTISLSSIGSVISIRVNTKVIIRDIILKGRKSGVDGAISNNNSALIKIENGTVELKGNAKVIDNTNSSSSTDSLGGGVYIFMGKLIMRDSSIVTQNTASSSSSSAHGGGIYNDRGTLLMYNNSSISKNSISGSYSTGGGVILGNANLEMYDSSSISENTASYLGGGVYVVTNSISSNLIMRGNSKINNNNASEGGGVYLYSPQNVYGYFEMNDNSSVVNNYASSGGGIYISAGYFTMNNNSSVSNNRATYSGGGIYASHNLIMNNSSIISNNIADSGAGIYSRGNSIMNDNSIISNNSSHSSSLSSIKGVGVNINSGTFTMNDNANILGNILTAPFSSSSTYFGAGVYVDNNGTLNLVGGKIYGNNDTNVNSNIIKDQYNNLVSNRGSSLYKETSGSARYGVFNGNNFISNGNLNTTDNTIIIEEGLLK